LKKVWKFKKKLYFCSRFQRKGQKIERGTSWKIKWKNVLKTLGSLKRSFTFAAAKQESKVH